MINTTKNVTSTLKFSASILAILALSLSPALAQTKPGKDQTGAETQIAQSIEFDGIFFGDDSSQWANDNECDDPRFIGPAAAIDMEEADTNHDASDCLALYQAGAVTLKPQPSDIVATIDFGDNSSEWADNGKCDDPRFGGPGADELLLDEDMNRDAQDCRALFLSGEIDYLGDDINAEIIEFDNIVFGDNLSQWKSDGECDDPRFRGQGMAAQLVEDDNGHDAEDCLALYKNGSITLIGNTTPAATGTIDFGDDASEWANDDECDDPRFAGEGVAGILLDADLGHDATDCRALFDAGKIYLGAASGEPTNSGIDFGDDSSQWANDNECDDPRFAGEGVADLLVEADLGRDATDCRGLYESGLIFLANNVPQTPAFSPAEFGDNESIWADDGECDDPRFIGEGMAFQLLAQDIGHDANDCEALVLAGQISLITAQNVDFGDDDSPWPSDGECDDPRFAGEGTAVKLDPLNLGHDATDCRTLLNAGAIEFVGGFLTMTGASGVGFTAPPATGGQSNADIDWGDDASQWSNDGECDDPRFSGPGTADQLVETDQFHDATDCRTLFQSGEIQLAEPAALKSFHNTGFDFGDNGSEYANNQICDDPRFAGPGADPVLLADDEGHDAADCRALFGAGQVFLANNLSIDFGNDTSQWANDGECDDPRFDGKSMAADLNDINIGLDATDCRASFELGRVYLIEHGIVNFGDDSSEWANDNECDDPRFAGLGAATQPLDENLMRDASDCRANYRASTIYLLPEEGATPAIDFGDNTSNWASDGECDDPRFFGPGSAQELVYDDIGHDAFDCETLLNAGQIEFGAPATFDKNKSGGAETGHIDYGDDTSQWSLDGECDDPRFSGPGAATTLLDDDLGHDATDCRSLLENGQLEYIGGEMATSISMGIMHDGIDFGDDTSAYANNQICDDLRFAGEGVDGILLPEDEGHDATDCLNHFNAGTVQLASEVSTGHAMGTDMGQDLGDDTSSWANDGQCDDPRFEGPGASTVMLDGDLGHDATDCATLLASGAINWIENNTNVSTGHAMGGNVDFGDDTSAWANDNQCDDPRFGGDGASTIMLDEDLFHDATDCAALFAEGKIFLLDGGGENAGVVTSTINFGDNTSAWAHNNMCDDPRFEGEGTAPPMLPEDEGRDAADCQALHQQGLVQLIGQSGESGGIPMNTPPLLDPNNVDFGDNSSLFADDGECDDPRFAGSGMAPAPLFEGHTGHDANDCQTLFDAGAITVKGS